MVSADGRIGRTDSNRDESATHRNDEPVGEPARARTYAMRPVNRWKGDYLRVPRRRRAGYFKCAAALAMISPALCAKPLSSTGATAAFDFHERFARSCCSCEKAFPLLFSAWTIRPLLCLTQRPLRGLVPRPMGF